MYISYFLYNSGLFFTVLNKKIPLESYFTEVYTVQFTHSSTDAC